MYVGIPLKEWAMEQAKIAETSITNEGHDRTEVGAAHPAASADMTTTARSSCGPDGEQRVNCENCGEQAVNGRVPTSGQDD